MAYPSRNDYHYDNRIESLYKKQYQFHVVCAYITHIVCIYSYYFAILRYPLPVLDVIRLAFIRGYANAHNPLPGTPSVPAPQVFFRVRGVFWPSLHLSLSSPSRCHVVFVLGFGLVAVFWCLCFCIAAFLGPCFSPARLRVSWPPPGARFLCLCCVCVCVSSVFLFSSAASAPGFALFGVSRWSLFCLGSRHRLFLGLLRSLMLWRLWVLVPPWCPRMFCFFVLLSRIRRCFLCSCFECVSVFLLHVFVCVFLFVCSCCPRSP